MNKIIIVILVILLILGVVVGFLFYSHFFSSKDDKIENKVKVEIVEKQIEEETDLFVIDIKYPLVSKSNDKDINEKIEGLIQQQISDFKGSVDSSEQMEGFANGLYITYEVSLNTPSIISIIFDVSVYFSGAAHPVSYTRVFNYNLEKDEPIESIFEGSYLETISDYCIEELVNKIEPDEFMEQWIYSGAGPTEDNYKYVAFGEEGLVVIFDQYQVAAYALGKQFVEVPYNEIKDLLTPEIISLLNL